MEITNKYCINCKHLLGKRTDLEGAKNGSWSCYHPSNIQEQITDLVTGEVKVITAISIYELRKASNPCGIEGTNFELYEPPSYTAYSNQGTGKELSTPFSRNKKIDLGDI